jgi:transcriptional regulator with XRE-family HTH domain
MSPSSPIDIQRLAALLRTKRGSRGLRTVADEISENFGHVSASTLSRIEQGNVPDLETFMYLCAWLGVSADSFSGRHKAPKTDPGQSLPFPEAIEAHLRADRTLPAEAIDALSKMIQYAYRAAQVEKLPKGKDRKER